MLLYYVNPVVHILLFKYFGLYIVKPEELVFYLHEKFLSHLAKILACSSGFLLCQDDLLAMTEGFLSSKLKTKVF